VNIEIVLAYPRHHYELQLTIRPGTTIREVVVLAFKSGLVGSDVVDIDPQTVAVGIYGLCEPDDYRVIDGDRVEVYRALLQDPKEWRRQKANAAKKGRAN